MRVLVTGASGFIGLPLVRRLEKYGHSVLGLSRTAAMGANSSGVKWLQADLDHPATYCDAIRAFSPDCVIHLAWKDIPDYSFEVSRANLERSLNFLSFVTGLGSCRKIVVSGSCWEFNRDEGECLESEAGLPKDDFTWAKHALRSWLKLECEKKCVSLGWMRVFYVYGPRQRLESLIPSILNTLKKGEIPQLHAPRNCSDFVYVDDVAEGFSLIVSQDFPSGVYNLGSGISTSVLEVCRLAERIVRDSENLTTHIENEKGCLQTTINFWANISQSQQILGWTPTTSLEEGIRHTWKWMQ